MIHYRIGFGTVGCDCSATDYCTHGVDDRNTYHSAQDCTVCYAAANTHTVRPRTPDLDDLAVDNTRPLGYCTACKREH